MDVLRHTRSTRREAVSTTLFVGAVVVGAVTLRQHLFPDAFHTNPWLTGAVYASLAITVVAAAVFVGINLAAGEFVCSLDEEHLECVAPVLCGQSFRVAIREIEKVQKRETGDSHSWYLYSRAGQRFWLTNCYGNPADTFIAAIKARNPAVVEVDA